MFSTEDGEDEHDAGHEDNVRDAAHRTRHRRSAEAVIEGGEDEEGPASPSAGTDVTIRC